MPIFFLLASFVSGILTLVVYRTTEPVRTPIINTVPKISLAKYYAQRDFSESKMPQVSFANLLTGSTVLGSSTESATQTATLAAAAKPLPQKSSYTIALLGDSMIDTLGPDLAPLKNTLKGAYPLYSFTLLNYGASATDIEYGLTRLTQSYTYMGKTVPSLLSQNPDIVVVESFAYNHWTDSQADLDRHWLTLAKIVDTIKGQKPQIKIVIAAAVAPYCPTYTDGSANLPPERKQKQCETVKKYLDNAVRFAKSENLPIADAYHASLKNNEGNPIYINQKDHIHPSDAGKILFSQKISQVLF